MDGELRRTHGPSVQVKADEKPQERTWASAAAPDRSGILKASTDGSLDGQLSMGEFVAIEVMLTGASLEYYMTR